MNVKICMILATITGILILVNIYKNKVKEGFYDKHYNKNVFRGNGGGKGDAKDNLCVGMDKDKKVYCVGVNNNNTCPPEDYYWDNHTRSWWWTVGNKKQAEFKAWEYFYGQCKDFN